MKQAIIAALLIAAGAVLAHLHVVAQTYHPVVRLAAPDGLTYTALQDPTSERQACGEANERFIVPLRDPVWHIASLMKQHALFCADHARDGHHPQPRPCHPHHAPGHQLGPRAVGHRIESEAAQSAFGAILGAHVQVG